MRKEFANYKMIADTYNDLTLENLEYIKSLKDYEIIEINGYKILMIHGDGYDYINNDLTIIFDEIIAKYEFDICLFGHLHKYLNTKYRNRYFINACSIGCPTDYPTYKYCIIEISDDVKINLREFSIVDTYEELKEEYEKSQYYKENYIWCDLILKGIRDGDDYCGPFIKILNNKIRNIIDIKVNEFNRSWEESYELFYKKINEIDFVKLNRLFKQNNLTDINTLFDFCRQRIFYGWIDEEGNKHYEFNNSDKYFLQSPLEIMENKIGICWDMTELHRKFFNRLIVKIETYFLYYYINDECCPSHSILVYYDNKKVYWFEPMFNSDQYNYQGIHEYENINELLEDFKIKFTEFNTLKGILPKNINNNNYNCYKYYEPKYHIKDYEFYEHCRQGEKIEIE